MRFGVSGLRQTSEIISLRFSFSSAFGRSAKYFMSAVVKYKRVLDTTNKAPRRLLRSFVNHFQQQNLQGNLAFYRRKCKPLIDKRTKTQAGMAGLGRSHVTKFVACFPASAIQGDIAYCQNSSCTQRFT